MRYCVSALMPLVLDGERPLRMGGRALDILQVLLEHAGSVVSKDELIARVWPTSVVEEINLRVHIAALRRALGGRWTGRAALYRQRPATRLQLYRFGPA